MPGRHIGASIGGRPLLTIFSCPKAFRGHINLIQRNALKSWLALPGSPEVILLGSDEGVAGVCREFGIRHIPEVQRNHHGTPLIPSIFNEAQRCARFSIMCYVNADIILLSDHVHSTQTVISQIGFPFLLLGRRWDLNISESLVFDHETEMELRRRTRREGKLLSPNAIDYFVFPKGLFCEIPPFALGRPRWDNWIIYHAKSRGIRIVDLTVGNVIIHQNHDYAHIGEKDSRFRTSVERLENEQLLGRCWPRYMYNVWDASFILHDGQVKRPATLIFRRIDSWLERVVGCMSVALRSSRYLYPLFVIAKSVWAAAQVGRKQLYKATWSMGCQPPRTGERRNDSPPQRKEGQR